MRFKIKALLISCLLLLVNQNADASRLPDNVWEFVKQELPKATQRFDSVVVLDSDTMYVPLYPSTKEEVEELKVEYTYPENKKLSALPEVFILNNDYVFMKIFKDKKGNFTITDKEDLPREVKLGVMPQDMLVPTNLKIPEKLKIIMGDLLIPNRGDNLLITTSDSTVGDDDSDIVKIAELKDFKTFFANNKTKFVLVYDKGGNEPLYEIKLSGLPNKIVASPITKYALAMYFGSKTAEVVDLVHERVLTKIDFENIPSDVDLDPNSQIAYVTSARANSIYMVDLSTATLAKTIKSDRNPDKISVSSEDKMLVFNDKVNENIYIMNLADGTYSIKKIGTVRNLSRLLIGNGNIVAISRTQNKAFIYKINAFEDEKPTELVGELILAEKPTDAILFNNKAYILCSKDGIINVYDFNENKMLEPIALESEGFYSKIKVVPNKNLAIVTGIDTKKIILIDLETSKIDKKANANLDVADVVIIDKLPPVMPTVDNKEAL